MDANLQASVTSCSRRRISAVRRNSSPASGSSGCCAMVIASPAPAPAPETLVIKPPGTGARPGSEDYRHTGRWSIALQGHQDYRDSSRVKEIEEAPDVREDGLSQH